MRLIRDLNPESQKMLERIYRASKHHQVRERAKCILLSFQGTTIEELSGIFGVTRKTIYNWLTAWEDRKLIGFYNRRGRGRKPKLTEAQGQQVIDWVRGGTGTYTYTWTFGDGTTSNKQPIHTNTHIQQPRNILRMGKSNRRRQQPSNSKLPNNNSKQTNSTVS